VPLIILTAYSGKHNVTVWHPSIHLSVPFFITFTEHVVHTQCDSPGGSMFLKVLFRTGGERKLWRNWPTFTMKNDH